MLSEVALLVIHFSYFLLQLHGSTRALLVTLATGIEKCERNVLPVLNNLLENREMPLEDGRFLISRYCCRDYMHDNALKPEVRRNAKSLRTRAHENAQPCSYT